MKRILCLLLTACLLLSLCACDLLSRDLSMDQVKAYAEPYIGTAQTTGSEFTLEDYHSITQEAIDAHESAWRTYSSDVYYSVLDEGGQKIYRILLYAMDMSRPYILIDDRILAETEFEIQEILYSLALDNPMIEQNLEWSYGDFSSVTTQNRLFFSGVTEKLTGLSLEISEFGAAKLEKKKQALEKAEAILAAFPTEQTPLQRAKTIYTWLGKNVQYFNTTADRESVDYLYDALCTGRSNCDGFANAFSLLCRLSGIRCCEKNSVPVEGEEGHTWNALELDGLWYNVDATAADEIMDGASMALYFGFADDRQRPAWGEKLAPVCTGELYPPDCILTQEQGAEDAVKKALNETMRNYLIVYSQCGELSQQTFQEIANTTRRDLQTNYVETSAGTVVYYLYFS